MTRDYILTLYSIQIASVNMANVTLNVFIMLKNVNAVRRSRIASSH